MNKIKNWVKNNKKKSIIYATCLVVFIVFVVALVAIISFLMPDTKASVYGDRCEVTDVNPVASERKGKIKEYFDGQDKVKFISFDVKCNLIDIVIEVDDSLSLSKVKTISKNMLGSFSEEEIKNYDIEIMVKSNDVNSEVYPKIGVHHKQINGVSGDNFVW